MEIMTKVEARALELETYYTGSSCNKGHDSSYYVLDDDCVKCIKNRDIKREHDRQYRIRNRELLNEKSKKRYENNKEHISRKDKEYYQKNRDYKLKYANEYREENKDAINARNREYRKQSHVKKHRNERETYLRKHCPKNRMTGVSRALLQRTLKALNTPKTDYTINLLGYSATDLREHVEKYMVEGMTWENFGEVWCLDHRTPLSRLIDMGIDDPAIINHLDNLRPLFVAHNLSKWTRTEKEYFDSKPELYEVYPVMINTYINHYGDM